jgi:uncharacterized repeat protein (TIGR03803 family)
MKNNRQQKAIRIVATLALTLALAGIAIPAQAQTFTSLHSFGGIYGTPPDGSYPTGLVQGANGYLYGATTAGGNETPEVSWGTVFRISTTGTETILDNLYTEGLSGSQAGLALATNGDFYGVSNSGSGANSPGVPYKVTPSGAFTTYTDSCTVDCGTGPNTTMVQASNGDLYGTNQGGGAYGQGTIFKLTLAGAQTTLHSFCETQNTEGYCLDGNGPYTALVQGTNGDLYGATQMAGPMAAVRSSKSPWQATLRRFTPFAGSQVALTAHTPRPRWFRAPAGTSTG